ncbi:hypothetical protein ABZX88_35410 [Kitasatospora aureofaciens]|uniref:hypothetical protein n=1 Tax=Kitasatospora aureofaciens TaxID=1894 RepID=UPI0033ACF7B5
MTPPARRSLGAGPQPVDPSAPQPPAPARRSWPLLPVPVDADAVDDDEDQAVPEVPTGRRRLWAGPRG